MAEKIKVEEDNVHRYYDPAVATLLGATWPRKSNLHAQPNVRDVMQCKFASIRHYAILGDVPFAAGSPGRHTAIDCLLKTRLGIVFGLRICPVSALRNVFGCERPLVVGGNSYI